METKRLFALALAPALLVGLPLLAAADPAPSDAKEDRSTPGGPRLSVFHGASVLHMKGACLDGLRCVGANEAEAGSFLLAGGGSLGKAVVTWTPVDPAFPELRVGVHGIATQGRSPLELELGTLPPGRHKVDVAPVTGAKGSYDQRVDWSVSFLVQETPSPHVAMGSSGYRAGLACVGALGGCDPATRLDEGAFLVPWPAREATFYASWTSGRALRWEVAGRTVEATSPLRLDLGALPADEHVVRVLPVGASPLDEERVSWQVVLLR